MKTIRQKIEFNASPHEVFEALMDSEKHCRFTGGKAVISRKVGGKFTAYDGYVQGKNLEIVQDEKIVQEWRSEEEGWPESHFSTATFVFKAKGKGTALEFTQENVPDECCEDISQGWQDYYWKPLKEMLEK